MAAQNVGIYALSPFSTANPTPAQQQAIALDGFVSSGMQIKTDSIPVATPDQVQSAYATFGQSNPNAGGGWLWNFSFITPDQSKAYATAVRQGLQGVSPS